MATIIRKKSGDEILIDDDDFPLVSQFTWYIQKKGRSAYARTHPNGAQSGYIKLHNLIMNPPPGMEVDHRDGNGLNNRRDNLRICTHRENMMNRKAAINKTSQYKGVSLMSPGKWICHIRLHGELVTIGVFRREIEAANAYDLFAIRHFGEYAKINFPQVDPSIIDKNKMVFLDNTSCGERKRKLVRVSC